MRLTNFNLKIKLTVDFVRAKKNEVLSGFVNGYSLIHVQSFVCKFFWGVLNIYTRMYDLNALSAFSFTVFSPCYIVCLFVRVYELSTNEN